MNMASIRSFRDYTRSSDQPDSASAVQQWEGCNSQAYLLDAGTGEA